MEFKEGDRVLINPGSEYYGEDPYSNPRDIIGTIYDIEALAYSGHHTIYVKWDNTHTNCYRPEDLLHECIEEVNEC